MTPGIFPVGLSERFCGFSGVLWSYYVKKMRDSNCPLFSESCLRLQQLFSNSLLFFVQVHSQHPVPTFSKWWVRCGTGAMPATRPLSHSAEQQNNKTPCGNPEMRKGYRERETLVNNNCMAIITLFCIWTHYFRNSFVCMTQNHHIFSHQANNF